MASLLFAVGGTVVNALAFSGTNFVFNRLTDHGEEECRRYDITLERLQKARGGWEGWKGGRKEARGGWNEDRMKRLGFINKRLRET